MQILKLLLHKNQEIQLYCKLMKNYSNKYKILDYYIVILCRKKIYLFLHKKIRFIIMNKLKI